MVVMPADPKAPKIVADAPAPSGQLPSAPMSASTLRSSPLDEELAALDAGWD
jgi:hypothetical protein